MNEYKNAVESFENTIIECGEYGSLAEAYEVDETMIDEDFANHLDSEGLELLVTVEDFLNGECMQYVFERQIFDSIVNGQHSQAAEQLSALDDKSDFFDFIDSSEVSQKDQLMAYQVMARRADEYS